MTRQILSIVVFILAVELSIARLQRVHQFTRDDTDDRGPSLVRPQIPIGIPPGGKPATKDVLQGIPSERETAKKLGKNLPFLKFANKGNRFRPEGPVRPPPKSDVVFIIDDSGSISSQDFHTSLSTLGQIITKASLSTKFAAVKYSSTANLLFQFVPPREAKMMLQRASQNSGSTNTQAALRMARTELFQNPNAGQCSGGKRVAVLVTDGMSNVHKSQTVPQANLLKSAGVEVFVIAVGEYDQQGLQEMVQICSFPYEQHLFRVESSRSFRDVVSFIPKS